MKCQILFFRKNKKTISICHLLKNLSRVLSIKEVAVVESYSLYQFHQRLKCTFKTIFKTFFRSIVPVEAVLRPKGMGLGADRKQAQDLNDSKKGSNSKKSEEDDGGLSLKKGSCCLIEHGTHKDLYGMVGI